LSAKVAETPQVVHKSLIKVSGLAVKTAGPYFFPITCASE
jgi:hypothetical protein